MPNTPNDTPVAMIILAAGMGTRMKSNLPKVMHQIAGQTMLGHVIHTAKALQPERIVTVIGPSGWEVEQEAKRYGESIECVVQEERLGTAHAVRQARDALQGFEGHILVLYGDTPLLSEHVIAQALNVLRGHKLAVLGMRPESPTGYGRLVLNAQGTLERIVEEKDATPEERQIGLCNSGILAFDASKLWAWLDEVENDNANGEYYLTDLVAIAAGHGERCGVAEGETDQLLGVNDRQELARAEAKMQARLRMRLMQEGVTMVAPETVFLSRDVVFEQDVIIHPHVVIGPGVILGEGAEIKSFSHLEQCKLGRGAVVGPYARLRPGTELEQGARIGNFVEVKNSQIAEGAKINHLSYIGDSAVGAHSNIGAGTITCNYDGYTKSRTVIGEHVFIGSDSCLIAPVSVGDGAVVGAGSVITEDVPQDALAVSRTEQHSLPGKGKQYHESRGGATKRRVS